jgi:bifunctional DNase/RNase
MLEMQIYSIRGSMISSQHVAILKEKNGPRYLPIWIGPFEAEAITVKLRSVAAPRPLTHDLIKNLIDGIGAMISYVVVNDLHDDTFFARIVIQLQGKDIDIDSRPSDAIAIALRTNAPIYVEDAVLDKAGIILEQETTKPAQEEAAPPAGKNAKEGGKEPKGKVDEKELKRLSAFKDFVDTLNLEDFDKRKS